MSRLNMAPETPVRSLDELAAVARAVRKETARRYVEAARQMREHGSTAAAEELERLAAADGPSEESAGRGLQREMARAPGLTDIQRILPEIFRDEAGEMATSRLATPYRVLAAAVREAERVSAFWAYVAAYAADAEVRMTAESLAREELDRLAQLRRERRRAYWAERTPAGKGARPAAAGSAAAGLERRLADALDCLAGELAPADAARARLLAGEARTMAAEASQLGTASPEFAGPIETEDRADALLVTAERLVEYYLQAADAAREEVAVARAQSLGRRAIDRLVWLGTAAASGTARRSLPSG